MTNKNLQGALDDYAYYYNSYLWGTQSPKDIAHAEALAINAGARSQQLANERRLVKRGLRAQGLDIVDEKVVQAIEAQ